MFILQTEHIRDWPEIKRLFDEDAVQVIKPLIYLLMVLFVMYILSMYLRSEIRKKTFHLLRLYFILFYFLLDVYNF